MRDNYKEWQAREVGDALCEVFTTFIQENSDYGNMAVIAWIEGVTESLATVLATLQVKGGFDFTREGGLIEDDELEEYTEEYVSIKLLLSKALQEYADGE